MSITGRGPRYSKSVAFMMRVFLIISRWIDQLDEVRVSCGGVSIDRTPEKGRGRPVTLLLLDREGNRGKCPLS